MGFSWVSRPVASPSRIIRAPAPSFTEPPGFCHSAFAYSSMPGATSCSKQCSRTSGVRPIMSSTDELEALLTEGCDAGRDIRNLNTTEPVRIISAGGAPSNNAILAQPEMTASTASQPQLQPTDADGMTRVGGWLFKRRTIIPLPLALAV